MTPIVKPVLSPHSNGKVYSPRGPPIPPPPPRTVGALCYQTQYLIVPSLSILGSSDKEPALQPPLLSNTTTCSSPAPASLSQAQHPRMCSLQSRLDRTEIDNPASSGQAPHQPPERVQWSREASIPYDRCHGQTNLGGGLGMVLSWDLWVASQSSITAVVSSRMLILESRFFRHEDRFNRNKTRDCRGSRRKSTPHASVGASKAKDSIFTVRALTAHQALNFGPCSIHTYN